MPSLKYFLLLVTHVFFSLATAQAGERPETATPCDYYAQKVIGANTTANQRLVMVLVLHSALLGKFSKYNTVPVDGLVGALTPTKFNGQDVDLNGYFNGAWASTNMGGEKGVAVNFFDDGGVDAAKQLKPGNGNKASNQYRFFTHVYSYFGGFFKCSGLGSDEFPAYKGSASMYETHKFMALNNAEMGFFIDQAVRGLLSFGFTKTDAQGVNDTLSSVFNKRCAAAAAINPPAPAKPQLQAICVAPDCGLAAPDTCSAYPQLQIPAVANAALLGNYTKAPDGKTSFGSSKGSQGTDGSGNIGNPTGGKSSSGGIVRAQAAGLGFWLGSLWLSALAVLVTGVVI